MLLRSRLLKPLAISSVGALLCLSGCVGSGMCDEKALGDQEAIKGRLQAEQDQKKGKLVIFVFRNVAPGELDSATGLPLADAGSDAVDPLSAIYYVSYNRKAATLTGKQSK